MNLYAVVLLLLAILASAICQPYQNNPMMVALMDVTKGERQDRDFENFSDYLNAAPQQVPRHLPQQLPEYTASNSSAKKIKKKSGKKN
ncbi:hypothetical protein GPALN_011738 [Globodera pallida]|nr:hypothetical protein GPALN_011738 [Globodera pallida]